MYDFIDIGSSKGGSIKYCKKNYGVNGYGIDIDERKVQQAVNDGYDVRLQTIYDVEDRAKVVTMIHVLEHLPSKKECFYMIEKAVEIGERVVIHYPFFDADYKLYKLGLRFFWSNWTGHTCHLTTLELHNICTELGVSNKIEGWQRIGTTMSDTIVPLDAPKDGFEYSEDMGKKTPIFLDNVYREVRAELW